jgi:fumarate reductase flavoprotein subunit
MNFDVVVVGGGLAGLVAGCRAAELGLKTVVLEKGVEPDYLCNSRVTGGVFHFASESMLEPPEELTDKVVRITGGFVERDLIAALAADGRRSLDWISAQQIKFGRISAAPRHSWVLAPLRMIRPGLDPSGWKGRAGDVMLRLLGESLRRSGGEIHLGVGGQELIFDKDRCVGITALNQRDRSAVSYGSRAIVLADGGFQGDDELVGRFISKHPHKVKRRNAGTGQGDAVRMLEKAGARLVGMKYFYGHLLSRDAMQRDALWPYPTIDALAGIVINSRGHRFLDEGLGGVYMTNAIAWSEDPLDAWMIFDDAIWQGPGKGGGISLGANPLLPQMQGTMYQAGDLKSLETQAGFAAGTIEAAVATYNDAVDRNALSELAPIRSTDSGKALPIRTPPFYAVPMCAGLTFTMGGAAVDKGMRVLREDGTAIAGLYVAGKSAGGLEGGEPVGYVGGLSLGLITGLRAAEAVKADVARQA